MAAAVMNEKKKARVRGRLPVKKSINMAVVGIKKTRISAVLLVVLLILVAAAAVGKFLVMDRLEEVNREEQKVRNLRTELSAANAKLDSFGELKEKYAHYTFADMTSEELKRVERSDVVDLIERIVLPNAELNSWNVKQNQLTLNVTLDTLQDTNLLAQILNDDDMVEFATVKNAVTHEIKPDDQAGSVQVPAEGEEPTEGEEPGDGEAPAEETLSEETPAEAPAEEAPAEEASSEETPAEGSAETEDGAEGEAEEDKELQYNVTAQIIVYLIQKEG